MGIPAHTFFCENGHLVADIGDHEMLADEDNLVCPQCKSVNIRMVLDWHDGWGNEGYQPEVPYTPISIKKKRITVEIPTYDVSKLFGKK